MGEAKPLIILYNIYMYTHGGRSEVFKRVPCELIRNRRTNSPRRVRGSICACAGRSRRGVVSSPSRLSSWGAGCAGCEINPGSARALQEPQRNPRSPIAQRNMREGGTSAGALSQFLDHLLGRGAHPNFRDCDIRGPRRQPNLATFPWFRVSRSRRVVQCASVLYSPDFNLDTFSRCLRFSSRTPGERGSFRRARRCAR